MFLSCQAVRRRKNNSIHHSQNLYFVKNKIKKNHTCLSESFRWWGLNQYLTTNTSDQVMLSLRDVEEAALAVESRWLQMTLACVVSLLKVRPWQSSWLWWNLGFCFSISFGQQCTWHHPPRRTVVTAEQDWLRGLRGSKEAQTLKTSPTLVTSPLLTEFMVLIILLLSI